MKKSAVAALAALVALATAASPHIRGTQFAPAPVPDTPRVEEPVVGSYEGIRNVAVLSGMGDTIELLNRDPFKVRSRTLDVAAWRLDDRIEETIREHLSGRFSFVNIPCDRARLAATRRADRQPDRLEGFLRTIPAAKIDAYIIVRPDRQGGLQLRSGRHGDNILWARYEMDVVDAHSFALIARSTSRLQLKQRAHPDFPAIIVGKELTLDRTLTLSPENQVRLHGIVHDLLDATLAHTIRSLALNTAPFPADDH